MSSNLLAGIHVDPPFRCPPDVRLEELVTISSAGFSETSHRLQFQNFLVQLGILGGHIENRDIKIKPGRILDAGCGDFMFGALWEPWFLPYLSGLGVDLSGYHLIALDINKRKVHRAKLLNERLGNAHLVLDPASLGDCDLARLTYGGKLNGDYKPGNSVVKLADQNLTMIISNSVFHWLTDKQKSQALKDFYQVQPKGGVLMFNAAVAGTAEVFLRAYRIAMMKTLGSYGSIDEDTRRFINNPIGFSEDGKLEGMVKAAGYKLIDARQIKTSITYKEPDDYLDAAFIYGFQDFTRPLIVRKMNHESRKKWWMKELRPLFLKYAKAGGKGIKPWYYSQTNLYVVAVKA